MADKSRAPKKITPAVKTGVAVLAGGVNIGGVNIGDVSIGDINFGVPSPLEPPAK